MTIHPYLDNIHRFCDLLYLKVFRIVTLGKIGLIESCKSP